MSTAWRTALPASRPRTLPDDLAARRSLRGQVARLERELTELACSAWPRQGLDWRVSADGGARLLSLGELEEVRDALALRLRDARRELAARTEGEELNRRLIEEMRRDPAGHRWMRVRNEDIGEPGCLSYHVRPRAGLLGMLAGWWRVVVSSGCPLPRSAEESSAEEVVLPWTPQRRGARTVLGGHVAREAADEHRGLAGVLAATEVRCRGHGVRHRDRGHA
jgi:hypothetical protein